VVGLPGDVDEVVGPLQLRHRPQHRKQEAQVVRDRRLQQDVPVDELLDLRIEGIDDPVALGQHP
jgi:hypothetical protein